MLTGIIVIGRNEGERLVRCLRSLRDSVGTCVYVDSGSTDDSVARAREAGAEVVQLDLTLPFTAARARNTGFRRCVELHPDVSYVQFLDGDCELQPGWLDAGVSFLEARADVGVAWGLQQEREPHRSPYNALIDMEWDAPRGEVGSSTGNLLCRRGLFESVGGFRESLIAGEDPEFCLRVRRAGQKVWHLDVPMVLHDAAMLRFSQWWRRAKRGGHAFAEGAALHGSGAERHFVRETRSIVAWGGILPGTVLLATAVAGPVALLLLLAYPLQVLRVARAGRWGFRRDLQWAAFCVLAKFPEFAGVVRYHIGDAARGRRGGLIEYK